ncbi:MAG TPA: hypothetical protein VKI44_03585 [Acetobacteraceae bacterium]|nr:hypothetical protein [Acetobacteraceae bacterium]
MSSEPAFLKVLEAAIAKARLSLAGAFVAQAVEDVRALSPELAETIAARWRELASWESNAG